jgi:hypothetical protein
VATDATLVETHDTPDHDTLVPDPQVQKEFGVTAMSIWRWDRDLELIKLGWPPPIRIRSRKFRSRIALENFKRVNPGFWSQVQQGYANRICTSLPSSLRIA